MNLDQRTVVILGPVKATMQNVVMTLTTMGADVAIVDANADQMQRFCQTVTDQREVNEKHGRAMTVKVDFNQVSSVKDGLSKVAQSFGSIDVLIDSMSSSMPTPFAVSGKEEELDPIIHQNLTVSLKATQYVSGFLKSRKRGRIIYLLQDAFNRGNMEDAMASAARTGLLAFSKALSRQLQEFNVTVNCLSLGLTEEYLMGHFPDSKSIKEAHEKMKAMDPVMRISDPEKIANAIVYLAGPSGAAITGQNLILS